MFISWRSRSVTGQRGNWSCDQSKPGLESHCAALLRSYREGGKVRKETVARLGYFTTTDGILTVKDADDFWRRAVITLDRLDISGSDRAKAEQQLADRIEVLVNTQA